MTQQSDTQVQLESYIYHWNHYRLTNAQFEILNMTTEMYLEHCQTTIRGNELLQNLFLNPSNPKIDQLPDWNTAVFTAILTGLSITRQQPLQYTTPKSREDFILTLILNANTKGE